MDRLACSSSKQQPLYPHPSLLCPFPPRTVHLVRVRSALPVSVCLSVCLSCTKSGFCSALSAAVGAKKCNAQEFDWRRNARSDGNRGRTDTPATE